MALNAILKQLIETKLAHTHKPQWALPITEVRQAFRNLWTPAITGEPVSVRRIEDITIPGVDAPIPSRVYAPDGPEPCPIMLYFHGGGYVKGGIEESDAFCRNLARVTRHMVLSIDYRLAPEHRFPAALNDAVAATIWAATHAVDLGGAPGPIVVCGESAGGNLATVTCLRLRLDPRVAIRYQVLLQPVVDFTLSFPSIAMLPTECLVPREDLAWYYRTYRRGQCDPRDPRVSPIYAEDLSGLPAGADHRRRIRHVARRSRSLCRTAEGCGSCDPLHLRRRNGARFPANARHRSGRTDGNRGNRTSFELMERSHTETMANGAGSHGPTCAEHSGAQRRLGFLRRWIYNDNSGGAFRHRPATKGNVTMFLTTAPLWVSGALLVGVPTLLAMAGPIVVRRYVSLDRLTANNEVAGFKFATVGVLYAVLLAFVIVVVWEKFSDAESDVSREAGAAATIYRLVEGIDGELRPTLRNGLTAYLQSAMTEDWAAMEKGKASPVATRALDEIYAAALTYKPTDPRGAAILSEILRQLSIVTEARRARIVKASGTVPDIIRLVLFGGAVLTIGFTFFFGTKNLRAQSMMTGALALLIFSGLLIIVSIDHPFTGAVKVEPVAISEVLEDLGRSQALGR